MEPELRFGPSGAIGRAVRTPPLGGEIVEWDLVGATRAQASAEPAPGGVSLLQADHLRGVVAADAEDGAYARIATKPILDAIFDAAD